MQRTEGRKDRGVVQTTCSTCMTYTTKVKDRRVDDSKDRSGEAAGSEGRKETQSAAISCDDMRGCES